jgi:hypothetical protein
MAMSMIMHASIHMKGVIDESLWPQAVTYATRVYNNTPKYGVFPADISLDQKFHGTESWTCMCEDVHCMY